MLISYIKLDHTLYSINYGMSYYDNQYESLNFHNYYSNSTPYMYHMRVHGTKTDGYVNYTDQAHLKGITSSNSL